jgi:hypothetical protein
MTSLFPHTQYAEDQPLYHTILTGHVIYRGFQTGAIIGLATGVARSLYNGGDSKTVASSKSPASIVRSVGFGSTIGGGLLAVILPVYMMGKTDIEWKDRSWRLLENKGQVAVDDWSGIGALLGVGSLALRGSSFPIALGWKEVMGRAALGSIAGIVALQAWSSVQKPKDPSEKRL